MVPARGEARRGRAVLPSCPGRRYSWRSACCGSMRVTRLTGTQAAVRAAATISAEMAPRTSGIRHRHAPEHAVQRRAEPEAPDDPQGDAEQDGPERLAEQHRDHVPGTRAQGHADAELARPLPDHPGHDAIDAHHRQQDRQGAEDREERGEEAAVGDRRRAGTRCSMVMKSCAAWSRSTCGHRALDRAREAQRVHRGPHGQDLARVEPLVFPRGTARRAGGTGM